MHAKSRDSHIKQGLTDNAIAKVLSKTIFRERSAGSLVSIIYLKVASRKWKENKNRRENFSYEEIK